VIEISRYSCLREGRLYSCLYIQEIPIGSRHGRAREGRGGQDHGIGLDLTPGSACFSVVGALSESRDSVPPESAEQNPVEESPVR